MNSLLLELFPTPIMVVDYEGSELEQLSADVTRALDAATLAPDLSRHHVLTSYSAGVNDIITLNMHWLRQAIDEQVLAYQSRVGARPRSMQIQESWINSYDQGGYMSEHEHPGMTISGVYYHQADEQAGALWFRNPNPLMRNLHWPSQEQAHYQTLPIPAQDGRMVLFPSWMAHSVSTVQSTLQRKISVSFNLQ